MMGPSDAEHWEGVYSRREPEELSWHQPDPERSLALIAEAGMAPSSAILDLGGGASRLAGRLLAAGYEDVTVADISGAALDSARAELGAEADRVAWLRLDVRRQRLDRRYDLWHDRALFHFMVDPDDRHGYLANLRRVLRPGGHLVLATFGPEGPTSCSGLPVRRYGSDDLLATLGAGFELLSSELETHRTPAGGEQQFLYAHLRRLSERR